VRATRLYTRLCRWDLKSTKRKVQTENWPTRSSLQSVDEGLTPLRLIRSSSRQNFSDFEEGERASAPLTKSTECQRWDGDAACFIDGKKEAQGGMNSRTLKKGVPSHRPNEGSHDTMEEEYCRHMTLARNSQGGHSPVFVKILGQQGRPKAMGNRTGVLQRKGRKSIRPPGPGTLVTPPLPKRQSITRFPDARRDIIYARQTGIKQRGIRRIGKVLERAHPHPSWKFIREGIGNYAKNVGEKKGRSRRRSPSELSGETPGDGSWGYGTHSRPTPWGNGFPGGIESSKGRGANVTVDRSQKASSRPRRLGRRRTRGWSTNEKNDRMGERKQGGGTIPKYQFFKSPRWQLRGLEMDERLSVKKKKTKPETKGPRGDAGVVDLASSR